MLIFALYLGEAPITPEYHVAFLKGIRVIFTAFTLLCLGGIPVSLARGKTR